MRHTAAIAVALSLSTPAAADECFDLNNMQEMKLRGTIMQNHCRGGGGPATTQV
jgi:hypothetical protein